MLNNTHILSDEFLAYIEYPASIISYFQLEIYANVS